MEYNGGGWGRIKNAWHELWHDRPVIAPQPPTISPYAIHEYLVRKENARRRVPVTLAPWYQANYAAPRMVAVKSDTLNTSKLYMVLGGVAVAFVALLLIALLLYMCLCKAQSDDQEKGHKVSHRRSRRKRHPNRHRDSSFSIESPRSAKHSRRNKSAEVKGDKRSMKSSKKSHSSKVSKRSPSARRKRSGGDRKPDFDLSSP